MSLGGKGSWGARVVGETQEWVRIEGDRQVCKLRPEADLRRVTWLDMMLVCTRLVCIDA